MPCMDGGPSYEQVQREKRFFVAQARLACDRCRDLEKRGLPIPSWAVEWWEQHKRDDNARERRESAEREARKLKESALAKLSPEELKALGVRDD
jgi:hypothetical protein